MKEVDINVQTCANLLPAKWPHCKGWVGVRSLLFGLSQFASATCLVMSGDVELNPGPLDPGR